MADTGGLTTPTLPIPAISGDSGMNELRNALPIILGSIHTHTHDSL